MAKAQLPVSFRVSPDIKAAAEKAAADDRRSLSSCTETALAARLTTDGHLSDKRRRPKAENQLLAIAAPPKGVIANVARRSRLVAFGPCCFSLRFARNSSNTSRMSLWVARSA